MRLWRRQEPDESAEQAPARLQARPAGQLFPIVKLGEGYDIAEVDAFLGTVQAATADQIREVRFSTVRLRGGYDMDAVDRALDDWEKRARKVAPS